MMLSEALQWIVAGVLLVPVMTAQRQADKTNPAGNSEQAIAEGRQIYSRTCTVCHGLNGAAGDRGPALGAGRSYVVRTDQALFEAIQNGIPGTAMPSSGLPAAETWEVVAYIRSLRATASDAFVPGNVANGERVFRDKGRCDTCHMIRGSGGISGPDLSNIAGERTVEYIRDALTKDRPDIPRGYQPVEVITADGRRLSGMAKNEDNFSLQLLDKDGRLQLFTSDELREVIHKEKSIMPRDYGKVLAPGEFQDLLAFLSRQLVHKPERRRRSEENEP
jgi:putative heme-binding domain-containing protein